MKLVRESLSNFQRGKDITKTLGIGDSHNIFNRFHNIMVDNIDSEIDVSSIETSRSISSKPFFLIYFKGNARWSIMQNSNNISVLNQNNGIITEVTTLKELLKLTTISRKWWRF